MSFACRLGRNTALEATSRSWTTGASSRGFHIAATSSAQALVTPGTRLRPQTGPRLRPQVTPKATPAPTSKFPKKATPSAVSKSAQQQKAAAPLDRAQRFAAKFEHVSKHTGLKPEVNNGVQIRDSAWQQLLENSTSRADVEKVVEIMPRWPAMGRQFSTDIVNLLIQTCYEHSCPDLAVRVVMDPGKYSIHVPSTTVSARLIGALTCRPAPDTTPLTTDIPGLLALFEKQGLPRLDSELVPCIVLLRALIDPKIKNKRSEWLAKGLFEDLLTILKQSKKKDVVALQKENDYVVNWALGPALYGIQKWQGTLQKIRNDQPVFEFRRGLELLRVGESPPEGMTARRAKDKKGTPAESQ